MTNNFPNPPLTPEETLIAKMSSLDWRKFGIGGSGDVVRTDYTDEARDIVLEFLNHHKIDLKGLTTTPAFQNGNYTKKLASIIISEPIISAAKVKGLDLLDFAERSPSVNPPIIR